MSVDAPQRSVKTKGSFGYKTSDQIRTEGPAEKNAFLPNLVRVCGFVKARACAIWGLRVELISESGVLSSSSSCQLFGNF